MLPETPLPDPAATSTTPAKETAAAPQKRRLRRSTPRRYAITAVTIGRLPKISATVDALVRSTA